MTKTPLELAAENYQEAYKGSENYTLPEDSFKAGCEWLLYEIQKLAYGPNLKYPKYANKAVAELMRRAIKLCHDDDEPVPF